MKRLISFLDSEEEIYMGRAFITLNVISMLFDIEQPVQTEAIDSMQVRFRPS